MLRSGKIQTLYYRPLDQPPNAARPVSYPEELPVSHQQEALQLIDGVSWLFTRAYDGNNLHSVILRDLNKGICFNITAFNLELQSEMQGAYFEQYEDINRKSQENFEAMAAFGNDLGRFIKKPEDYEFKIDQETGSARFTFIDTRLFIQALAQVALEKGISTDILPIKRIQPNSEKLRETLRRVVLTASDRAQFETDLELPYSLRDIKKSLDQSHASPWELLPPARPALLN